MLSEKCVPLEQEQNWISSKTFPFLFCLFSIFFSWTSRNNFHINPDHFKGTIRTVEVALYTTHTAHHWLEAHTKKKERKENAYTQSSVYCTQFCQMLAYPKWKCLYFLLKLFRCFACFVFVFVFFKISQVTRCLCECSCSCCIHFVYFVYELIWFSLDIISDRCIIKIKSTIIILCVIISFTPICPFHVNMIFCFIFILVFKCVYLFPCHSILKIPFQQLDRPIECAAYSLKRFIFYFSILLSNAYACRGAFVPCN